jgi:hypothetical protein
MLRRCHKCGVKATERRVTAWWTYPSAKYPEKIGYGLTY